jgi:flagellar protein FliO/FliZ
MNPSAPALDWLHMAASFALVLVLLGAMLWLLRRLQQGHGITLRGQDRAMEIVQTQTIGTRQKLVLVRVRGHEVLLGATPNAIAALHSWPATEMPSEEPK